MLLIGLCFVQYMSTVIWQANVSGRVKRIIYKIDLFKYL